MSLKEVEIVAKNVPSCKAVVVPTFNLSTQESEAGGSLWVQGQPVLQTKLQNRATQWYPTSPPSPKSKAKTKTKQSKNFRTGKMYPIVRCLPGKHGDLSLGKCYPRVHETWVPFPAPINQWDGAHLEPQHLRNRGRRIRNSKTSSATKQVWSQPGLHETLFLKIFFWIPGVP